MQDTVHNEMAKYAYDQVKNVGKKNQEFRSLARSFPSILQVNGLGAAAAFLSSKSGKTHVTMYQLINNWTKNKFSRLDEDDLVKHIVEMESSTYRIYVNEVMNLCLWVKRFAEGMIDGEVGVSE